MLDALGMLFKLVVKVISLPLFLMVFIVVMVFSMIGTLIDYSASLREESCLSTTEAKKKKIERDNKRQHDSLNAIRDAFIKFMTM